MPVLFQEETDPQLVRQVHPQRVQDEIQKLRKLALGAVPELPPHGFVGRSRQLLAAERLLLGTMQEGQRRFVVLRGEGGEGKTALACELRGGWWRAGGSAARRSPAWRMRRAAALRRPLANSLSPGSRAEVGADDKREWQLVERALEISRRSW